VSINHDVFFFLHDKYMKSVFLGATDVQTARLLGRRAIRTAVAALTLAIVTIPAQVGVVLPYSLWWKVLVGVAIVSSIAWMWALCLLSRSRGHHALWGLILLVPIFILFYPWIFPDKLKNI